MEIGIGAAVECVDGDAGRVSGLILQRGSLKLVGLVVTRNGIAKKNVVVPLDVMRNSEPQRVYLRLTSRELEEQYHSLKETDYAPIGDDWELPPPGSPEELVVTSVIAIGPEPPLVPAQSDLKHPFLLRELTNIQEDALLVTRVTRILCPEGAVGTFAGILFDPTNNETHHIIVRLSSPSHPSVPIPTYLLGFVEENEVYVKAHQPFIESLAASSPGN